VLDVGTGTGHVALLLAGLGYDVTGIDLAEGMLAKAREKAAALSNPPALRLGDAVAPDFPPASFDVVTSRYVLWTLRTPQNAAANWRALLRPGGVLAAVDSTWFPAGIHPAGDTTPLERLPSFRELYDRDVLSLLPLAEATGIEATADVVRAAGFADVTVTPLPEILDLDRRYGVADGHEARLQFLITGTAV
jgi:SAM-dependent methyltransferase